MGPFSSKGYSRKVRCKQPRRGRTSSLTATTTVTLCFDHTQRKDKRRHSLYLAQRQVIQPGLNSRFSSNESAKPVCNITLRVRGVMIAWLVVFYGISTHRGYLMPNLLYIYIYIYIYYFFLLFFLFNPLYLLMVIFVLHHCLTQSHDVFDLLIKRLAPSFLCIYNLFPCFAFHETSIGDLTTLDNIFSNS